MLHRSFHAPCLKDPQHNCLGKRAQCGLENFLANLLAVKHEHSVGAQESGQNLRADGDLLSAGAELVDNKRCKLEVVVLVGVQLFSADAATEQGVLAGFLQLSEERIAKEEGAGERQNFAQGHTRVGLIAENCANFAAKPFLFDLVNFEAEVKL